ncbi:hypothetical protein [Sulfurisphaera ohwakuensis]|uniref:hypothetical protein n=1 Tax=Sulfurisphaera ohwakuensis TaxID=69656 RepID=UPI0018C89BE8
MLDFSWKGFYTGSSPPWKGRGFPSRGFIVPTIDSGLHLSFGGQSGGAETHPKIRVGDPSSILSESREREKRNDSCPSLSPIELGKSVINITKRYLDKGVYKYKGDIHLHPEG